MHLHASGLESIPGMFSGLGYGKRPTLLSWGQLVVPKVSKLDVTVRTLLNHHISDLNDWETQSPKKRGSLPSILERVLSPDLNQLVIVWNIAGVGIVGLKILCLIGQVPTKSASAACVCGVTGMREAQNRKVTRKSQKSVLGKPGASPGNTGRYSMETLHGFNQTVPRNLLLLPLPLRSLAR